MNAAMRRELEEIIGQAVGAGSMCWDPAPSTQVFDSTQASKVVDWAMSKISMFGGICKKCGEHHKPRCDKCGSTTDLRSWHGPCGKCAFQKKSAAMSDEVAKIAAGVPLGRAAMHSAKGIGGNAVRAMKEFRHPVQGVRGGWNSQGGRFWKGMTLAGGAIGAPEAFAKEDRSGQMRGRGERISRWAGSNVGGLVGSRHGFTGAITGDIAASTGAGAIGRAADKMLAARRPPPVRPNPPVAAKLAPTEAFL